MSIPQASDYSALISRLQEIEGVRTRLEISAAEVTTVAAGGLIPLLVEPRDTAALIEVIKNLNLHSLPFRVLGAGSNILVGDHGVSDCVIRLGRGFRYFNPCGDGGMFEVGASMSLMSLSRELSDAGWAGLEFAGGIPASLGGAVKMNAGAHDGDMSKIVAEISVVNSAGELVILSPNDLNFAYRKSSLSPQTIVVSAKLKLNSSSPSDTASKRALFLAERKKRQPLSLPSFGSVFKNPKPDTTAGMLIEKAGLKGHSIGGAQISALHANWIVNPLKNALASDIIQLMRLARDKVYANTQIELEPEVLRWNCEL